MSIIGKWKLASSENFDEYLQALGVSAETRQKAKEVTPVLTIIEDGGVYTMQTDTSLKSMEIKFKLGEEFEEDLKGTKCKSVITREGNKMIHIMKAGDKTSTIERVFSGDTVTATLKVGNVVCTRVYKTA